MSSGPTRIIYEETFDRGPGAWVTGRDIAEGSWHRNIFGHRGGPAPLDWSTEGGETGGFASSGPPWYFDDNHGLFAWLYLAFFVNRSSDVGLQGEDLRNALIELTLRGHEMALKGASLYFWIQGDSGLAEHRGQMWNWALTSYPIDSVLLDGDWRDLCLRLPVDENEWSPMGLLNGGLARRIVIGQDLRDSNGTLHGILAGGHANFGFLLCGVDPNDPPTGRFDLDCVRIRV